MKYVRGKWTSYPRASAGSPDDVPPANQYLLPVRVCEQRNGSLTELATIGGGTSFIPFELVVDHDMAGVVLNMNDTSPRNNSGDVTYRVSISHLRPPLPRPDGKTASPPLDSLLGTWADS